MTITSTEILFEQPVKIKQDVEIVEFNNKAEEKQYLAICGDRHYVINSFVYNLLLIITKFGSIEDIRKEFSCVQNTEYYKDEIISLINDILVKKELVETLIPIENKRPKSFLYFKMPIFSKRDLDPITFLFQNLFRPAIAYLIIGLILTVHVLFFISFSDQAPLVKIVDDPLSFILSMIIMLFSVIFHEFGHSSACRFHGAKYEEIGFGIYLRFPVFYSNITDAWRLPSNKRVIIDVAGIYFQYIFNLVLITLFLITKQDVLIITIKIICIQTLFSLNPFFRYDGYWIATDLLGIPNLRKKSSEMLTYLTQKYLLNRKVKNPITQKVKPLIRNIFTIYAAISNMFFIYIVFAFSTGILFILKGFPMIIQDSINVFQNSDIYTLKQFLTIAFQLTTRLLIIALSFIFFYTIIRRILETIKNLFLLAK